MAISAVAVRNGLNGSGPALGGAPSKGRGDLDHLVTWFETMPAGSLKGLVLDTDDVRSDVETLKANGHSFTEDVTDDLWGMWASFDDPDGNGWILTRAKEIPQG